MLRQAETTLSSVCIYLYKTYFASNTNSTSQVNNENFRRNPNQHPYETKALNNQDKILEFNRFKSDISQHDFQCALIVSTVSEEIYLQSLELSEDIGIFKFMLKIKQAFSYEVYHSGINALLPCYHKSE